MKKLILTAVLSCIICTIFAQKTFKQLNFHKANTTSVRVFDLVTTLAGPKTGTININTKDSTITISADGEAALIYKIKQVQDETSDQYDHKRLKINFTNANGNLCTAMIEREYAFKSSNEMVFSIKKGDGTGKGYFCSYYENLFEN
jgi:hypothetical protein